MYICCIRWLTSADRTKASIALLWSLFDLNVAAASSKQHNALSRSGVLFPKKDFFARCFFPFSNSCIRKIFGKLFGFFEKLSDFFIGSKMCLVCTFYWVRRCCFPVDSSASESLLDPERDAVNDLLNHIADNHKTIPNHILLALETLCRSGKPVLLQSASLALAELTKDSKDPAEPRVTSLIFRLLESNVFSRV